MIQIKTKYLHLQYMLRLLKVLRERAKMELRETAERD